MDSLLKAALVGTGRSGELPSAGATPADALVTSLAGRSAERQLLLAAGARAIYRQAGFVAAQRPASRVAPDDTLPPCSSGAARLLASLLAGQQAELLPEALERLRLAGRRVPPAFLPDALEAGARRGELRPALIATIGERGRWLAGHNQAWGWATARPVADDVAPPEDAEALWEEGVPAQRLAILRLVRAHDPARGREWLAGAWKGEKADFRAEAAEVLATGLSPDDEPFLETILDDRSGAARAAAAALLARLPDSAFATRLRERADPLLNYTPGLLAGGLRAAARALVRGGAGGKLVVSPPESYDKAWARDAIAEKPPTQATGARAWWLQQLLALVPPSHWAARFGTDPATLIAAAQQTDWPAPLLAGWERAAILHGDAAWAAALWQHWAEIDLNRGHQYEIGQRLGALIAVLPAADAEALLLANAERIDYRWGPTLQRLARPWSPPFARAMMRELQRRVRDLTDYARASPQGDLWLNHLGDVACALPGECFSEALLVYRQLVSSLDPTVAAMRRRQIDTFGELIRTRQRLMEELPL